MNLFFNQDALPTDTLPGDVTLVTLPAGGGIGIDTLSTQGAPPPLLPGRRYFLGVQNTGAAAASFTVQVNFNVSATANNIIPLTNGVPFSATAGGPMFYSFTVPTNAVMATFQLLQGPLNVADLYARNSLPVPGPLSFDYASIAPFLNEPCIVITTNSMPVPLPAAGVNGTLPLSPATWYLSVYNEPSGVNYQVLATYVTSSDLNIINLNAQPNFTYNNAQPDWYPTNLMYSFTVTNSKAAGLQFTVTNKSSPLELGLLVGDGVFPTPEDFYIGSMNPGPGPVNQTVVIATNASLTNLSGIWYAAVDNMQGSGIANYSITATVLTKGPATSIPLFIGASISSPTDGFTMYWNAVAGQTYQIQVSTNLTQWSVATNITAQSSTASYTDAVPVMSQTSRFFRILVP
jgi:hypothetical protein